MNRIALALALLVTSIPALAADIEGKWTGSIETPNGPIQLLYEFKSNGTTLTGTTTGPDGNAIPLQDVRMDGNKISFSFTVTFGPEPATFAYTGVVSGNELKLHSDFMGQPIDLTLKKAT